jgi:bacillithiol system protein YtxJ
MSKTKIETIEEFEQIVKTQPKFLMIKHSLTCPISQNAFEEYEKFVEDHQEFPTYFLYVQEARPLSNYIAETFSVKHESPQALLFQDGKVVWHTSHWNITYDTLTKEIAG